MRGALLPRHWVRFRGVASVVASGDGPRRVSPQLCAHSSQPPAAPEARPAVTKLRAELTNGKAIARDKALRKIASKTEGAEAYFAGDAEIRRGAGPRRLAAMDMA